MRDFIFRAKSIVADSATTSNYWLEGSLIVNTLNFDGSSTYIYHIVNCSDDIEVYLDDNTEVWPETVSQYINIDDKNGKKIFDGDIVRFRAYRGEPHWIGTVTYDERNALYLFKGVMPYRYDSRYPSEFEVQVSSKDKDTFEVLGNKWDNPELLGEDGYIRARDLI